MRASEGATAYKQMTGAVAELKQLSVAEYNLKSQEGTSSLNFSLQLALVIYPLALILAEIGLYLWRREFLA